MPLGRLPLARGRCKKLIGHGCVMRTSWRGRRTMPRTLSWRWCVFFSQGSLENDVGNCAFTKCVARVADPKLSCQVNDNLVYRPHWFFMFVKCSFLLCFLPNAGCSVKQTSTLRTPITTAGWLSMSIARIILCMSIVRIILNVE